MLIFLNEHTHLTSVGRVYLIMSVQFIYVVQFEPINITHDMV